FKQLFGLTLEELLWRLTERTRPRASSSDFTTSQRQPEKIELSLDTIVAAGAAGVPVSQGGTQLLLSASSHAAARLEVQWNQQGGGEAQWYPLVPCSSTRPPEGSSFRTFMIRAQQNV